MSTETTATVIAHSVSEGGKDLATLQLCYPLPIHGEVMTHRVFSRNARSSRAVPIRKMLEEVRTNPWVPKFIGADKPGMVAGEELTGGDRDLFIQEWLAAAADAAARAENMLAFSPHKQLVNRVLGPYLMMHTVLSSTEWENFFQLRLAPDAEPHMRELAQCIFDALGFSTPKLLHAGDWHLPYIDDEDREAVHQLRGSLWIERGLSQETTLVRMSVARCARVSYRVFDADRKPTIDEDLALAKRLDESGHWSPFEHQATPDHGSWNAPDLHGNFTGWVQNRKLRELDRLEAAA